MRIELNAGGLSDGTSIAILQENLGNMAGCSNAMLSAFTKLRSSVCNINGGVGVLQDALDRIDSKIAESETHYSNVADAERKTEEFITYTRNVDKSVTALVMKNQENFYKVNPWARPPISIRVPGGSDIVAFINEWIAGEHAWRDDRDNPMGLGGGLIGIGLLAGFLSQRDGENNGEGVSVTVSGPSGEVGDGEASGSLLSGSVQYNGSVGGVPTSVTAQGELIGGSASVHADGEWDIEGGDASLSAGFEAEGHLASGSVTTTVGLVSNTVEGSVGNVGAQGEIGFTLFQDGQLSPSVGVTLSANANVAEGSIENQVGTNAYNVHARAEGSVLGANAGVTAQAGVITYTDASGATRTAVGAVAGAGAEAYLAEGTVSGGVTICGIRFDLGITGKAGGAGARAEGQVTTGNIGGEVDLGLGVGVGARFNIDFSGFENPFEGVDIAGGLSDIGSGIADGLSDIGSGIADGISDIGSGIADGLSDIGESIADSDYMPWNWI
ncbi:MAG: hypothetical protein K5695_09575 [Oscillospiraceae bacterium]|nr:hypothetical protein [Oscillospiraceae bacterium]